MDRLRNRDLRTNNNKCYAMYFDDDQNKDITNKTMPAKKTKTRSPRKKEPTKNYQTDAAPIALNKIGLPTTQETKANDAVAVTEINAIELGGESKTQISKPMDFCGTMDVDMAKVSQSNGNDGNRNDSVDSTTDSKRMNNRTMVDISTAFISESMDNNKSSTMANAKADDSSIDPKLLEMERNDRKRRLSQSQDRTENVEDDEDDDVESCGTDGLNYDSKKAKLEFSRAKMFQTYQPWVIKTYGDLAKTKTITVKKHDRILKALNGQEQNNPDSSKFRFWVKAKGFTTEKPSNFKEVPIFEAADTIDVDNGQSTGLVSMQPNTPIPCNDAIKTHLYVPNLTKEIGIQPYRKVAVVEQFFDIIYNVHVGLGGRSGRHAGQKRTYRTITESYAFLPRDAVTKFLAGCHMCKKTPRACSPSRLDDTYCTESSSEMDCLSYSPKSMSDMSVTSNELRMPTPLDHCNDANTSAIPMKLGNISNDQKDINRNPIDMDIKSTQLPCKLNESLMPILPSTTTLPMANTTNLGLNSNDAVYVDEFYRKISEYYRGIFSNIDIKDPNISSDVLNYYQLIRQFYEQTMAINIQRNTALGLGSLNASLTKIDTTVSNANLVVPPLNAAAASTLPAPTQNDVSTIDLTIHKPTTNESMIFNNIKNNNSFQNNININIGSGNDGEAVKERAVHETLLKMNDSSTDELGENKVTISSAGVSINVSSLNANSLKISCKTTPPKKRYSGYNDEANVVQKPSHASTTTATTPINLNRKFEAEAMTTAKRMRINSPHDDGISVKSNFSGNDDPKCSTARPESIKSSSTTTNVDSSSSMADVFPITSTYLQLMRSMGFNEDEALKFDNLEPVTTSNENQSESQQIDETYAGLMKDADKLKLMLLAWNYQNSTAVRNGTEAPDLSMVGNLWMQYQNALVNGGVKLQSSSPPQSDQPLSSPNGDNPDESSSSGQKDDDDGSEDDSDDRLDQNTHDPERLKAFNMFVRLFVDENLDRMIPISKQPKEKIQAIIDSCTRQFPEFSERARKRIRTYLKSCRRNKKTREGWEATATRPTPAHLTSVQAEQILASACENESLNAKRMRIGLDPISQTAPLASTNASDMSVSPINYPLGGFKTDPDSLPATQIPIPAKLNNNNIATPNIDTKPLLNVASNMTNGNGGINNAPMYRQEMSSPVFNARATPQYQNFFSNTSSTSTFSNASPTDLSMKQPATSLQLNQPVLPQTQPMAIPATSQMSNIPSAPIQTLSMQTNLPLGNTTQSPPNQVPLTQSQPMQQQQSQQQQHQQQQQQQQALATSQTQPRQPILHKLNPIELNAVRQLITGYRESANFLMRSAEELETLLLNQN